MKLQDILNKNISNLYLMRDEVAMEMIEASGKQLASLQNKLQAVEEAIVLKESGYENGYQEEN